MQSYRYTFRAMASEHELVLHARDESTARKAADAAIADVARIEAKYSRFREDSVTTAINRTAGGRPVAIDAETAALARYADRCFRMSDGAFDLTSGVLRRVWNFRQQPPHVPSRDEIDAILPSIGWDDVEWTDSTIRLPRAGMEIDFGGLGKEYAADRAASLLVEHGIAHALVNLGGDVRAVGSQPDGTPWRVGIVHPRKEKAAIGSVVLADGAVATSGDYERYFEIDGRRYCHILDPRTGMPADRWQSMSVVAPLCVVAGSCATIAMLFGDRAEGFLRSEGLSYLAVTADGELRVNEFPGLAR